MPDRSDGVRVITRKPRQRWWIAIGIGVLVIASGLAGFWLLRPQQAPSATTRTYTTPVTKTTETMVLNLTGTLAPQHEADLSFATSGTVTAVKAAVGQSVTAGQVLATIDDTQLKNAVTLAQANVTAAQTSYDTVAAASGVTTAQLSNAQAQVDSATAKLKSAKASLTQAQLATPIDGIVASVSLTVGTTPSGSGASGASGSGATGTGSASTSAAQIVVISPTSWKVNSTVGPADVAALKPGQAVTATVSGATATAGGTVDTIGVVATTSGGSTTFPVTILLDGNPNGFYDGVSVKLVVTTGTYPDVLSVPTLAISNANGTATVQKVVNGATTPTTVEVGQVYGDRTQVLAGLAEGDQVQVTTRVSAGAGGRSASAGSGIQLPGLGGGGGGPGGGNGGNFQGRNGG